MADSETLEPRPQHGFGQRIRQAILDYASAVGRQVSAREWGELVGNEEQREKGPYTSGAVGEWMAERSEPSIRAFEAMARVLVAGGVDRTPGYLAFGEEMQIAPSKEDEAARKLEEIEASGRVVRGPAKGRVLKPRDEHPKKRAAGESPRGRRKG